MTKEQKNELCEVLVRIGEDGFRQLCNELGWDYDSIQGRDIGNKSNFWIEELDRIKSVPALVMKGKELFENQFKNVVIQGPNPPRYFIASNLKEKVVAEEFKIKGDRFRRTHSPQRGDYLIFDLDYPPPDWITYLGTQAHVQDLSKPYYGSTIFIQREPCQEIGDICFDGASILCILNKIYPHNYRFKKAKTIEEMLDILLTLEEDRGARPPNLDKFLNQTALAAVQKEAADKEGFI